MCFHFRGGFVWGKVVALAKYTTTVAFSIQRRQKQVTNLQTVSTRSRSFVCSAYFHALNIHICIYPFCFIPLMSYIILRVIRFPTVRLLLCLTPHAWTDGDEVVAAAN